MRINTNLNERNYLKSFLYTSTLLFHTIHSTLKKAGKSSTFGATSFTRRETFSHKISVAVEYKHKVFWQKYLIDVRLKGKFSSFVEVIKDDYFCLRRNSLFRKENKAFKLEAFIFIYLYELYFLSFCIITYIFENVFSGGKRICSFL